MRNKRVRMAAYAIAAALVAVIGWAIISSKGNPGVYFNDASITAKVKTALFKDPSLKGMSIGVTTKNRVVALSGTVKSGAKRARAAEVARNVRGVRRVKNDLKLR
jgi:osmotically-inducible protein OsmY